MILIEHARFSTPGGGYINESTVVVQREQSAGTGADPSGSSADWR